MKNCLTARRAPTVASLIVILALASPALASPAMAADPPSEEQPWPIPPLLPEGPVTLSDGRVLPPPPSDPPAISEPAAMAAAHASDALSFTPGSRPLVPLAATAAPGRGAIMPADSALSTTVDSAASSTAALPNALTREVFGFLPYWMLSADQLQWMRYDLVSTIAYFGVAANGDGTLATWGNGWNGWNSAQLTGVINTAHARGVRVVLTVTMMSSDGGAQQGALLGNPAARAQMVSAIAAAVRDRGVDGVNLDFEPVPTTLRDQYTSFVHQLKAGLLAAGVGSYLTVCTMAGAATWATGYDLAGLVATGGADELFVMGYDFSWSGSARAGGVAPMNSPYMLDVNRALSDYLSAVPASEIIWGVPYYGRTWRTQSNQLNALTVPGASATSAAYYYPANLSLSGRYGRQWDPVGQVPWFTYYDTTAGSWIEGYYDDVASLGAKWDMVNQRGLAGTGMWALLMDQGTSDLWNLLAAKFRVDTTPPVGGIAPLPATTPSYDVPVSWRATDSASGVRAYTVQVRDPASGTWTSWLTDTASTSALWLGESGHTYQFRASAVDWAGNRQPWPADPLPPGASVAVGGFAGAAVDYLNVRTGAGTGFPVVGQLRLGERVAIIGGPIAAGGYSWYQVQYDWTEWPSADYPRVGWSAAASGATPYLAPAEAPSVTTLSPPVADYAPSPRRFSPNGDGALDGVAVAFRLVLPASAARLDVLDASGSVVAGTDLGGLPAGVQSVTWDGRRADEAWAAEGTYLLRLTVTDAAGVHVAPISSADAAAMAAWGVVADLTPPAVVTTSPNGTRTWVHAQVTVTFTELVVGPEAAIHLVDATTGQAVAGTVSYDPVLSRLTFDPTAPLPLAHDYVASLAEGVVDAAGNPLPMVTWAFRTALNGHPPGDYDGNGTTDLAVWRPANGTWYLRGQSTTQWGLPGDRPVAR